MDIKEPSVSVTLKQSPKLRITVTAPLMWNVLRNLLKPYFCNCRSYWCVGCACLGLWSKWNFYRQYHLNSFCLLARQRLVMMLFNAWVIKWMHGELHNSCLMMQYELFTSWLETVFVEAGKSAQSFPYPFKRVGNRVRWRTYPCAYYTCRKCMHAKHSSECVEATALTKAKRIIMLLHQWCMGMEGSDPTWYLRGRQLICLMLILCYNIITVKVMNTMRVI